MTCAREKAQAACRAMSIVISAVLPVFIIAFLGYVMARTGRILETNIVAFLIATVGTPALVFSNLATTEFNGPALVSIASATLLAISFYLVTGAIALLASGLKLRTYLPSL